MKWGAFKAWVESHGVTDDMECESIRYDNVEFGSKISIVDHYFSVNQEEI